MTESRRHVRYDSDVENTIRVRLDSPDGSNAWASAVAENESFSGCLLRVDSHQIVQVGDTLIVDWGEDERMSAEVVRVEQLCAGTQRLGCRFC